LLPKSGGSEDARRSDQRAHLKTCPQCSALVAELDFIISAAIDLRAAEEPSPRVWNSIEIALRKEGLIRPQRSGHSLLPSFGTRWAWSRWVLPVAAALLIAVGRYGRQHSQTPPVAKKDSPS
jgi:hypothetical protein